MAAAESEDRKQAVRTWGELLKGVPPLDRNDIDGWVALVEALQLGAASSEENVHWLQDVPCTAALLSRMLIHGACADYVRALLPKRLDWPSLVNALRSDFSDPRVAIDTDNDNEESESEASCEPESKPGTGLLVVPPPQPHHERACAAARVPEARGGVLLSATFKERTWSRRRRIEEDATDELAKEPQREPMNRLIMPTSCISIFAYFLFQFSASESKKGSY